MTNPMQTQHSVPRRASLVQCYSTHTHIHIMQCTECNIYNVVRRGIRSAWIFHKIFTSGEVFCLVNYIYMSLREQVLEAVHHERSDEDDEDMSSDSVGEALELFVCPRSMFSEAELTRFRLQICMAIVLWHLEDAWGPFGFSYRTLHRKLQQFKARWNHLSPEELLERAKQEGGMLDIHRSALDSIWHAVQRKLSGTVAANHEARLRNLVHAPSGSLPDRRQAAHFAEGVVTVYFVDQGLSLSAATKVSIMISSMAEGMLFIRYLWIMMQDLTDRQTLALRTSLLNPQPNGRHI